jgi:hypothetical protein
MIKPEVILLIRLLILVFMSILFIQSAMDKILNYKGNQQWIDGYFEKSIFKGQTKILLLLLTFLEITAGLLCLTGVFFSKNLVNPIGFYGLFLCSISFLSLFLGQRIAKDYAGAANIPGYFVVSLIGLITYII